MATDAWGHSWGGPFTRFVVWGAATQVSPPPDPNFGPPFLDMQVRTLTTIGLTSVVRQSLGLDASMTDTLERHVGMASPRISRSVKNT